MRNRSFVVGALVLATALNAGCGSSGAGSAAATTPQAGTSGLPATFFGIVAPEVLPADISAVNQALDAQSKAGIGLFRQPFLWQQIEPKKGKFDYSLYDRLVGRAATYGITVMPIVFGISPGEGAKAKPGAKVTSTTTMPPRSNAHFAAFAALLVKRYGTNGTFWAANPSIPKHPIVDWQVWNEPNLLPYWGGKPDAAAYGRLLKVSAAAIRKADPAAQVVTAGLPNSKLGGSLNTYVKRMIKAAGPKSFDVLALHPYAKTAAQVFDSAASTERVAEKAGAKNVGLWITEVGWATGAQKSDFTVTEQTQAQLVGSLLTTAAARATELRLRGVVYYAWRDAPVYKGGKDFWGLHTGLVNLDNSVKPSLSTFASTIKSIRGGS